jgi:RNA polymerase sigma factor for flagellar operon FliA
MPAPLNQRLRLRPDAADTARMWAYFVDSRDADVRAQLVAAYQGFARIMAAKLYARRVYAAMEFADYLQYATVGLLEAIDRFEPQRGFKFETYAASRINGAMLDGIAASSEIQQQIVARRQIMAQRVALLNEAEAPTTASAVFARLAELAIGLAVGFALEDSGMHSAAEGDYADNSYAGVELKQLQARVKAALTGLATRQRHVIEAHYLQHQPFEAVATAMGLSRGRIAQLHKEALGNLRARLQQGEDVDLRC